MPSGSRSRESSPDIIVWDHVIKTISANSQGQDTVGLLLGLPTGSNPQVVVIDDIVPSRPLSGQNGAFSQTILAELLDDWRRNHRDKQIVGWFRTISTPPRPLRLHEGDPEIHQSYFTQPYQVALAFSQSSSDTYVGFFKSDRGNLDLEQIYPFIELSDSPSSGGLSIRNLNVSETAQQGSVSGGGGGRQTSPSTQSSLPLILRFGLPILLLLAVLTPLLLHFGVIVTGGAPAESANIIELAIPSADSEGMSRIEPAMLSGPAEGITSITFMNLSQDENQEDGALWIERVPVNPLGSDPPGGFIDYAYYSIASRDTDDQTTITFEFEIPESWKELRDVGKDTIRAYKGSGDDWAELTTIGEVSLNEGKYVFKATSPGFSYFALGGTRANQPVSVTVKIPENYKHFVEDISVAKGDCTGSPISANVSFTCNLGTELVFALTNPRFTEWRVGGQKYSVGEAIRIISDMTITPEIGEVRTPTLTPGPTLRLSPTETPATATPEPTETPATATPEPTETPATATPEPTERSQVKVTYEVNPPGSGEFKAYQNFSEGSACEDGPASVVETQNLCPLDSDIELFVEPTEGYQFDEMEIQLGSTVLTLPSETIFPYKLESEVIDNSDLTITVDFEEKDLSGS